MSELPRGWSRVALHELLLEGPTNGYSPQSLPTASGALTLRLSATTTGTLILNEHTTKRINETVNEGSGYWLRPGDVLVQRANTLDYVGTAAVYDGPPATYIYPDLMMRIRADCRAVDTHYLWRFINSDESKAYFRANATGTAGNMPKINGTTLRELNVLLPPPGEQRRIAAKLQALSARSRRAKEALDAIPPLLERFRQSVLAAAFRGDLTADWREKHPDVEPAEVLLQRIRAERRRRWEEAELARMKAKGKVPGDDRWKERYEEPAPVDASQLPELPEGWCWAPLALLSWDAGYGTSEKCDYDAAGPPVLRIPNVVNGSIDLDDLKRAIQGTAIKTEEALREGDLLIIRTNGSRDLIGRAAIVNSAFTEPHYFASYLIRYRLMPTDVLPRWVGAIWAAPQLRSAIDAMAASSAGQYNVSLSNLDKVTVPIPPTAEQRENLRMLHRSLAQIGSVGNIVSAAQEQLERQNRSILAKAFRGELVPQDPSDEPASVLLERLRAERAAADAGAGPARRAGRKRKAPSPAAG